MTHIKRSFICLSLFFLDLFGAEVNSVLQLFLRFNKTTHRAFFNSSSKKIFCNRSLFNLYKYEIYKSTTKYLAFFNKTFMKTTKIPKNFISQCSYNFFFGFSFNKT